MQPDTNAETREILLADNGPFPNNPTLPLIVYRGVLVEADAAQVEAHFRKHQWEGTWRNGVYGFHHYHSNTHEVLGCFDGSATVQFGGPDGPQIEIRAGDVVILPAGASHKAIDATPDFGVVGAYPDGRRHDMCYGKKDERPAADEQIAATPLPATDPVFGHEGGLHTRWKPTARDGDQAKGAA